MLYSMTGFFPVLVVCVLRCFLGLASGAFAGCVLKSIKKYGKELKRTEKYRKEWKRTEKNKKV